MLRSLIVLATLIPLSAAADDENRNHSLAKLADAIAVARHCPTLELNGRVDIAAMVFFDLDLDRDAHAKLNSLIGSSLTCVTGRVLYGPNGTSVPGLLRHTIAN